MNRFNMRFNLYNCKTPFPPKADLFAKTLEVPEEEMQGYANEFAEIQNARISALREKYGKRLDALRGVKTLFFGDSITSDNLGYRVTVTRAAELDAVDRSISGGTTTMLFQDSWELLQKTKPRIVSIMAGANDSPLMGPDRIPQVSTDEYERNIKMLVKWSLQLGAKVLLFEVTPVHEDRATPGFTKTGKIQSNENVERYNAALRRVSRETGVELLSNRWIWEDPDRYCDRDGVHLSVEGQAVFADKWLEAALK